PAQQHAAQEPHATQNARPAASRKKNATPASSASATRNCTRKNRGGTMLLGNKGNTATRPNARRRQKVVSMSLPGADEGQKLGARRQVGAEDAPHRAGGTHAAGLANAANRHAGVRGFQHD